MSTEIEEQLSVEQNEDPREESSKKPKRSYTREFLLSLSELEICRKLPNGFDKSHLSEFEDSFHGIQDRQRVLGSSSLQGFRRTEYGSSPPARGDSSNYSRGLHRWDNRSSGRSETDSDSESGRRYGSQARRSWQNPERDGLLGSGSFPRPSTFTAGASVPRSHPNDSLPLNRSTEPYHPPRPYKAVPHSRRETNDSLNAETFGSTDCASEDRVEEEKKRRAEFELMRKEQLKVLQEKQKSSAGKLEDAFSDSSGLLENPSDGKIPGELDKVLKQAPQEDSAKLLVTSPAVPSRPLVPPGFVSNVIDKSPAAKYPVHADSLQVENFELEGNHQDMKSTRPESGNNKLQCENTGPSSQAEKVLDLASVFQAADHAKASSVTDVSEVIENAEDVGLGSKVAEHKVLSEPGRSTSILDKLFGNALTPSSCGTSNFVEGYNAKADDSWSPNTLQSKFAHWFVEEDKKTLGNKSSDKPNLLSFIVGGENGGSDVPDVVMVKPILAPETFLGHATSNSAFSTAEISEKLSNTNIPGPKAAVLTCEDLEQSILSEIGGNCSEPQSLGQEHYPSDVKAVHPGADIDDQASQHLLSLLQKGKESNDMASISIMEERSLDKSCDLEVRKVGIMDCNIGSGDAEGLNSSGKTLTLEALFGTAFMKELHSAQRNSADSANIDVDGGFFPSELHELRHGLDNDDGSILVSNDLKLDRVGHWLGLHDPGKEVKPNLSAEVDSKFGGYDAKIEVPLPEEDSLINLNDPISAQNPILVPDFSGSSIADLPSLSSNTPVNVIEKLASLGASLKDERSMIGQDPLLWSGPHDMVKPELPYQHLHPQASSQQLHAHQINHVGSLFHALDSHPAHFDPHLKFMPPEAIINQDASMHHQFPSDMGHLPFTRPNAGLPGFDRPIQPPILQQVHIAGNLPPPHLARGFGVGASIPAHSSHNPASYMQEHNPMQGFPFGQRQPNFGGPGISVPGPELGGANNPPEAFQRLLEMELRANPKQMHPFAPGGHNRVMYGHELDTGFRYR